MFMTVVIKFNAKLTLFKMSLLWQLDINKEIITNKKKKSGTHCTIYKDVIKDYYTVKCFNNSVINISPYIK